MRKLLTFGHKEKSGRNYGLISVPRRGALVKRSYRFIDTKRQNNPKIPLVIIKTNIYDPNRSAKITLISHPRGSLCYVLESEYTTSQKFIYNLVPRKI